MLAQKLCNWNCPGGLELWRFNLRILGAGTCLQEAWQFLPAQKQLLHVEPVQRQTKATDLEAAREQLSSPSRTRNKNAEELNLQLKCQNLLPDETRNKENEKQKITNVRLPRVLRLPFERSMASNCLEMESVGSNTYWSGSSHKRIRVHKLWPPPKSPISLSCNARMLKLLHLSHHSNKTKKNVKKNVTWFQTHPNHYVHKSFSIQKAYNKNINSSSKSQWSKSPKSFTTKNQSKAAEITSDQTLDLHPIPPFYVPHYPRSKHSLPSPQHTKMWNRKSSNLLHVLTKKSICLSTKNSTTH